MAFLRTQADVLLSDFEEAPSRRYSEPMTPLLRLIPSSQGRRKISLNLPTALQAKRETDHHLDFVTGKKVTNYQRGRAPPSGEHCFLDFDWSGLGRGNHVDFDANETVPLEQGEFLGQGANGSVYRTVCKGILVAWKRIYCRAPIGPVQRKEIEVLKKLNHHHIVQLVGTYTHKRFLGMLLWPVAVCDLGMLMDDIDFLLGLDPISLDTLDRVKDCRTRLEAVVGLESDQLPSTILPLLQKRILKCFGCLAAAISYLHSQSVRHKDLKPANVLLSFNGLWLTDFGTSTDFSEQTCSATNNGERGTPKYFAPEVAQYEPSGRAADIFSLGAIFLEMAAICNGKHLEVLRQLRPRFDRSYQANLPYRESWFEAFSMSAHRANSQLLSLIRQMLELEPGSRPTAEAVNINLIQCDLRGADQKLTPINSVRTYHDDCCGQNFLEEGERRSPDKTIIGRIGIDVPLVDHRSLRRPPDGDWLVSQKEKQNFDMLFESINKLSLDFISKDQAMSFFSDYALSSEILVNIWELAAIRHRDRLNRDDFAVAMHLINSQISTLFPPQLPAQIPPALVPPDVRSILTFVPGSPRGFLFGCPETYCPKKGEEGFRELEDVNTHLRLSHLRPKIIRNIFREVFEGIHYRCTARRTLSTPELLLGEVFNSISEPTQPNLQLMDPTTRFHLLCFIPPILFGVLTSIYTLQLCKGRDEDLVISIMLQWLKSNDSIMNLRKSADSRKLHHKGFLFIKVLFENTIPRTHYRSEFGLKGALELFEYGQRVVHSKRDNLVYDVDLSRLEQLGLPSPSRDWRLNSVWGSCSMGRLFPNH